MTEFTRATGSLVQRPAFLNRAGGMSERISLFNWSETPLGAVDGWKQSLHSALSICLNSNFPIAVYWGKELTLLYNDAWSPIPGNKHPWALGRPAREVWPEIWDAIEPQFAKAFSGEPGGSQDALLPMQRHGYTEECYFDFTFTPVYGEDGKVDGIFNAVIETTYQVINERRAGFLQKLARKIGAPTTEGEVSKKVISILKLNTADIPFCYIYSLSDPDQQRLVASTSPEIRVSELPVGDLVKNGTAIMIRDLPKYLDKIPVSYWPEPPSEAMLVPLKANNGVVTGFLLVGLSARRKFDPEYNSFVESFAGLINSALNSIYSLAEERKRAETISISSKKLEESEAALRIAKEQLELTFRNVPAAIYLFSSKGEILFLNNQGDQQEGGIHSPAGGQHAPDLPWFHESISDLFELRDESGEIILMENTPAKITLRSGKPAQKIIQIIHRSDGTEKWILASSSPLLNDAGELTMVLACSTDITFQKNAEAKIRESEENFRTLTQALPQLVWVTDASGKQEFASERWKEYTGIDPRDQQTWEKIIHPDDGSILASAWNFSMKTGHTYKAECRLKGKDGNFRWFHVHGEPIRTEKKEIIKWVGAFTDIHEQKLAEEQLRLSEEKLEYLVKKRTEELQRSNEDLQQFAHVASHDLKEPIRKIKVFSSLLQDEFNLTSDDHTKLYLSKIQSASDRMLVMMEGVLRYAGLEGYHQGIETITLNDILQSVETDLEMVIQRKKAIIERDSLPMIEGYPILIYQLFYNLISNALKFSRTNIPPYIQVRYNKTLIQDMDFAQFRIIDNGIGFEPENAGFIFNSFARLNSKEDYEGTGLGLALCKKIVRRHQGFIQATGKPGAGAEFTIQLPMVHPV